MTFQKTQSIKPQQRYTGAVYLTSDDISFITAMLKEHADSSGDKTLYHIFRNAKDVLVR